jgi:protein-S-isoprenylcysteine O-methyltransferase Ste14
VRAFAWTGASLFLLSLGYFVHAYAVTFAHPAIGGGAARAVTWNVALFTLFAIHHSVFARAGVREWVTRIVPPPLERSVYVWIASLLFIAVVALWRPVPGVAWHAEGAALWALRALQICGVWLTLRGAAVLDVFELAGIRNPEGFRLRGAKLPGARPRTDGVGGGLQASDTEFKTSGPYGWVRHPIYAGWFLIVFAASPMTMTRLVFAVVSGAYLIVAIPLEERSMRALTPGAYDRYMARVRWRLLPGVY